MWKEIPPFSFSAGERKIMAHFVVKSIFSSLVAAQPRGAFVVSYGCPVDPFAYHRVKARGQFGHPHWRIEDKNGPLTWKRAEAHSRPVSAAAFLPAMNP